MNQVSINEALASIRSSQWDLVLVDWRMPEMDGVELARCIQRELGAAAAPIIMLTLAGASVKKSLAVSLDGKALLPGKLFDPGFAKRVPLRILLAEDNPVTNESQFARSSAWVTVQTCRQRSQGY